MSLRPGEWHLHRDIASPVAETTKPGDIRTPIDTDGYEALLVGVVLTGGTAPTVLVDLYARDKEIAAGQPGDWMLIGSTTALANEKAEAIETFGMPVYARTRALTGAPTAITIKVAPVRMIGA